MLRIYYGKQFFKDLTTHPANEKSYMMFGLLERETYLAVFLEEN